MIHPEQPQNTIENQLSVYQRFKQAVGRVSLSLALSAGIGTAGAMVYETIQAESHIAAAESPTDCGAILVTGKDWLGGLGVDVHSNGPNQTTGTSCKDDINQTYNLNANPSQFGYGWQCVELANRLYATRGWYPQMTLDADTGGAARYLYDYAANGRYPGLTAHKNGSGYIPAPGDMLIDSGGYYGHVVIVDHMEEKTLYVLEQNNKDAKGNPTGWTTYTYDPLTGGASKGDYAVSGYIHAEKNTLVNTGIAPFSFVGDGREITDDNWVYTKVGSSAWPIKPKSQWTAGDTQYWGNEPQKVSSDDIHAHEVGYDQSGRVVGAHAPKDGTDVYIDGGDGTQYYFYEGRAYKLNSVAEMNDLGVGAGQRIPATGNRLSDFANGHQIILPNGSLYRFADSSRIAQVYIQPDGSRKSFYIPNATMLDCIQQTQNRGIAVLPQSTQPFVEMGVNVTNEPAGCTFPWHWSMSTPGGQQQFRVEGDGVHAPYTKRYYPNLLGIYLNSEGQPDFRKLASLPSVPDGPAMVLPAGTFFRNVINNEVFWQGNDGLAHKVNSMDSLSCMGGPALISVPPEAFQGGIPLGSPAECSLEGKLVRDTTDGSLWYMQNGQRHYIQNMAITNGLLGRVASTQGRLTDASDPTVKTYSIGADAFVPYGPPVFVKYANDSSIWLALPDGTRRHVMSLCGSGPNTPAPWQFLTMPDGEFNGHAPGPNWSASSADCNKILNGQTID